MTLSRIASRPLAALLAVVVASFGWVAIPTPANAYSAGALVLEYSVSSGQTVQLPLYGTVSATVNWGDTTSTNVSTAGFLSHTYASGGTKVIEITGSVGRYGDGTNTPYSNYWLKRVLQWGSLTGLTSLTGAFRNANQLYEIPNSLPSGITDLSYLFENASAFNADISQWDTSSVTTMARMFYSAYNFNKDISYKSDTGAWDVSKVTDFSYMFYNTGYTFNQAIGNWNTSSAISMAHMFDRARAFNQPLNSWDVSKVTNMDSMFFAANAFNRPLSSWVVDNVTTMASMFYEASYFNQDLSSWNVSKVTNLSYMFRDATRFNGNITTWKTGAVTTLAGMFQSDSAFNQNISSQADGVWDVSNVTSLANTFAGATAFNQDIGNWDTSKVTTLSATFQAARAFNQNIGSWSTGAVTSLNNTFDGAWAFNQDITDWDVSKVTSMYATFYDTYVFNQDVSKWNTGLVTNMGSMFGGTRAFDQALSTASNKWNTSNVTDMSSMFYGARAFNHSVANWDTAKVTTMASMFRDSWVFDLPMTQSVGGWNTSKVLNMSYMFSGARAFNQSVESWDTSKVTNMEAMFQNTLLFDQPMSTTAGGWNTSAVTNMSAMFDGARKFNQDVISTWNTSAVTNMNYMFKNTVLFDQPLTQSAGGWSTASVTSMYQMFYGAKLFDQNVSTWSTDNVLNMAEMFAYSEKFNHSLTSWKTVKVTNMSYMFWNSKAFNQPIPTTTNGWTTSAVTNMEGMFRSAQVFNQPLNSWDVSKVLYMGLMFSNSVAFNQPLNLWNTGEVRDMNQMFNGAQAFDNNVSTWDVSKVTGMYAMFSYCPFNQDISEWNTISVTNMGQMFMGNTHFNLPIDDWDVHNVNYFFEMFRGATAFNQPIYKWNVANATNMTYMFNGASAFDMDLSNWRTTNVTDMWEMFTNAGLKPAHYSEYLKAQTSDTYVRRNNINLKASAQYLCGAEDARNKLTNSPSDPTLPGKGWYIVDGGKAACKTTQTITFDRIDTVNSTDHFPENREVTLSASASSDLTVTFKWISGPCTVSGDKLTADEGSAGKTCVIAAQQHGDSTYSDAVQVLHWITIDAAAPVIATTTSISRGASSPNVTVTGTNFKSSSLAKTDFTVDVGTTGLTFDSVTYVSGTQVTLGFTGTAAGGDLTIQAKTSAFNPTGSAASNTLTITVPGAPVIATTSTIARTASNPTVVITGTDFATGVGTSDFTFSAGTTGLTLSSLTRNSATQVTLSFTGTAAVGSLTIQAKASAFDPSFEASNTLTISVPAAPVIATTSTIARTATDPIVTITGTGFKVGAAASDFTINVGTTGLTVGTVTRVSGTEVTIAFTGTAAVGSLTIQAKASAYTSAGEPSNTLTISVPAAPVISSTTVVTSGTSNPSIVITGTGFKSSLTSSDFTVDVGATGLTFATATRNSTTQVTLAFTGTAADGDILVTANASAYDSAAEDSNQLTFNVAAPTTPVIATTSTIANGASAPSVIVTGTGFKSGLTATDFTVVVGTTGLTLASATRNSATQVTLAFTGTAATGSLTIQAKASAFDVAPSPSNTLTIAVPGPAPVIATTSRVATGATAPSIVITSAEFKTTVRATDFNVNVGTTGLTFASVTRNSSTQVTLNFTGTAAAGSITIQAKASAYLAAPSASNTLTVTVGAGGTGGGGGGGGTGGGGGGTTTGPTLTVPSSVSLTSGSTTVTKLTANVPVTWSITGGADASLFTIVDGQLVFKTAPSAGTYTVEVTATDANGNTTKQTITVTVSAGPTVDVVTNPDGSVSLKITDPTGGTSSAKVVGTDKSGVTASIVDGKIVITDPTFSGKIAVELLVTGSDGSITKKTVDMVVLPKTVNDLVVKPTSVATPTKPNSLYVSGTLITWTASRNAKSYRVVIGGVEAGTTTATKFTVNRLLAKGTRIEVISLGGDSTVSGAANASALGGSFVVGNSGFDNNARVLNAASKKFLDKVAAVIIANGVTSVVIEGHTDNVGSPTKNLALSKARAEAVKAYLQSRVGATVKFTTLGSASSKPIASNKTAAGKAANRRVDITITY